LLELEGVITAVAGGHFIEQRLGRARATDKNSLPARMQLFPESEVELETVADEAGGGWWQA